MNISCSFSSFLLQKPMDKSKKSQHSLMIIAMKTILPCGGSYCVEISLSAMNIRIHPIDSIRMTVVYGYIDQSLHQRRKNTANLQTWFGGRFWPKIEEGLVVKNKILYYWHRFRK